MCLTAMEPPVSYQADEIRNKKVDVLRAIRPINTQEIGLVSARGQYGAGWIQGQKVPAYREEPGVSPDSMTETFAAIKAFVDNWRWQGVPFYMTSGKRLARKLTERSAVSRQLTKKWAANQPDEQLTKKLAKKSSDLAEKNSLSCKLP